MSDKLTIRVEREYEIDPEAWAEEYGIEFDAPDGEQKTRTDIGVYLVTISAYPEEGDFPVGATKERIVRQTAFRINGVEI